MDHGFARRHRQLRVFISSTFADMNAERDALTLIFPQIKALCKERGVEFVPIDLRWGITETSARQGRVLETCMREIDNSRPFFIGILGNRYGWIPSESDLGGFAESLRRQYPWLGDALSKSMSITEMEMQYAALSQCGSENPAINAAFFLREDKAETKPEFCETAGSEGERKLNALKEKIRAQSTFSVYTYPDPRKLADLVIKELRVFLDKEYPAENVESYDRTAIEQNLILENRSKSLFDISLYDKDWREWYASPDSRHLNITGHKGRGKSHILARIIGELRKQPDSPAVVYFDCSSSSDSAGILEFILAELLYVSGGKTRKQSERKQMLGCFFSLVWMLIKIPFLAIVTNIRMAFGNQEKAGEAFAASMANAITDVRLSSVKQTYTDLDKHLKKKPGRPLIVALDNLDYIDRTVALDSLNSLTFLPHIRFISTSSTGSPIHDYLKSVGKTTDITVGNLTAGQARDFVTNYLAQYGKQLDENGVQRDKIVFSNVGGNPLLLSYVLNLMVCFGSFEELDRYISELTAVETIQQLYEVLINNIREQFAGDEAEIAVNALAALAVSPNGLTEEEIKAIFKPSPLAWATVRPYVINICGTRDKELFLPTPTHTKAIEATLGGRLTPVRNKVAAYFERLLTASKKHTDKLGNLDTDKILEDNEHLSRQVRILLPLYFSAGMMKDLYYWVSYIGADMRLTQDQRIEYWKALYKAGYSMRQAEEPNIPPAYRRLRDSYSIQSFLATREDDLAEYSKKDLKEYYQRLSYVAGFLNQIEDGKWLTSNFIDNSDIKKEDERTSILLEAQNLFTSKEYDKLIALNEANYADDFNQALIDMFTAIALLNKNDTKRAYNIADRSFKSIYAHGALMDESLIEFMVVYSYTLYKTKEFENRDILIDVLENHKEPMILSGLNDLKIYMVSKGLTYLYVSKKQWSTALENAKIWQQSAKETGTVDNEVANFINNINKALTEGV